MIPSNTPKPSATIEPTQTKIRSTRTPNATQTPVPTPTVTIIPPYPTKQVLLDYDVSGNHSTFDSLYTDHAWSRLVLYTDGQLIIPGESTQQKILSPEEINQLLSRVEDLKFFELESNQAHDPTDKLYDMENQYERVYDALFFCVSVNGEKTRRLCAYEPFLDFLVPEMKSILKLLDGYRPGGMSSYSPDRILLWVQPGRSSFVMDLPQESIPWKDSFPSLEEAHKTIIYVQGDTAKEIYTFFNNETSFKVVNQDGIEYTVLIDIVLPHEEVTNLYAQ